MTADPRRQGILPTQVVSMRCWVSRCSFSTGFPSFEPCNFHLLLIICVAAESEEPDVVAQAPTLSIPFMEEQNGFSDGTARGSFVRITHKGNPHLQFLVDMGFPRIRVLPQSNGKDNQMEIGSSMKNLFFRSVT